jgi:hypothetical protein
MDTLRRVGVQDLNELGNQGWFQNEAARVAKKNHLGNLIGFYLSGNNSDGDNRQLIIVGQHGLVANTFTKNNEGAYKLIDGIPKTLNSF